MQRRSVDVRELGVPYASCLSSYMRTIVYQIPGVIFRGGDPIAEPLTSQSSLRASIVTHPCRYLEVSRFSMQYSCDASLRHHLGKLDASVGGHLGDIPLYIVIQVRHDLGALPPVHGQCVKMASPGAEGPPVALVVDCGGTLGPTQDREIHVVYAVLTAVKVGLGLTGGWRRIADQDCYLSDAGECLYRVPFSWKGSEGVPAAIRAEAVDELAASCRELVARIVGGMESDDTCREQARRPDVGRRLTELGEVSHLEASTDPAYLRAWFLQLYQQLHDFGETCQWQFGTAWPTLEQYRAYLAGHLGVEEVDLLQIQSLQKVAWGIIRSNL